MADNTPQSSAVVRVHACPWPDFFQMMNHCDRELYQWISSILWNDRPGYLSNEMQRIASAAGQQQYQQWSSCEAGRYAGSSAPKPGLRLQVASRLEGGGGVVSHAATSSPDIAAQLSVSFTPGSGPQPQDPCSPGSDPATWPKLPFQFLYKVDKFGINYYPWNTLVEFTNSASTSEKGIGPWEGSVIMNFAWSGIEITLNQIQGHFHLYARVKNPKVFDHWADFKIFDRPPPPDHLLARVEPFNIGSVQIDTYAPFDWTKPEGQRGHSWHIFHEYTHVESGQSYVYEQWVESSQGWNPVGMGGYSADQEFWHFLPAQQWVPDGLDGTWRHRICVYDFRRIPVAVSVRYAGALMNSGTSAITPTMSTPYIPGVSAGIASVEESITVRTVGITKAAFRLLSIQPVAGIGVLVTLTVVNELHVDACIVTPSLSGMSNRWGWYYGQANFQLANDIWVVRNLPAYSESDPVSFLAPAHILNSGDWPITDTDLGLGGYAAPLNQFPDGVYGSSSPQASNINGWPPPAYKVCSNPETYARLGSCFLSNGARATGVGGVTVPAYKAPGAEVSVISDPRFPEGSPTYFDQQPFLSFVEWTAEYKVQTNPEVWEPRTGKSTLQLDLPRALGRYGRYLTLDVASGRPMWSPYYRRWVVVFDAWTGGDSEELEAYLIDELLRPQFEGNTWYRNFQYTSIKKPFLTAGIAWWPESKPFEDRPGYINALPLIKETTNADTVDVALMGYW